MTHAVDVAVPGGQEGRLGRAARRRLRRPGQRAADPPGRRRPAGRGPAGHRTPPRPAARSAAVAASRTSRRAPAAPARARSARRSSPAAASSTARSRARTTSGRPKKMKAAALRGALRDRARDGRVHVVSALVEGDAPSTRQAVAVLDRLSDRRHVLVVLERADEVAWLSLRNVAAGAPARARPAEHVRRAGQRRRGVHRGCAGELPGRPGARQGRQGRRHRARGRPRSRPPTSTDRGGDAVKIADPRDILLAPVISEKSYGLLDENKYTFLVRPDANKTQIKIAVEQVFGVKVTGVNTLNRQGKQRRTRVGRRPAGRHQARGRQRRRRPAHRHLRRSGLLAAAGRRQGLTTPWESASTSRRRRVAAARASPTSSRSPGPSRRSRWCARCTSKGGRNNAGRVTTRHQGGGHKRAFRVIDFRRARQGRRAGQGRAHRVRPEPHRADRAAALRRRREALHPGAEPAQPGRPGRERPVRRHQARQQPAAAQHPGRHGRARDRAAARRRGQDRPLRRRQRPAGRQGRPVRPAAHALRRDPQRRRPLPGHGRRGRQRRAVEHQLGQGRPACAGRASARPSAASP